MPQFFPDTVWVHYPGIWVWAGIETAEIKLEMHGKAHRIARSAPQCRPLANTNKTRLLITALPSSSVPYWTYLKSPQKKIFDADCRTSYVLNPGVTEPNLTKFYKMYTNDCQWLCWNQNCDFHSVSEGQGDEWRSSLNCGRIAAKIARLNSVNFEIIG